MAKLHAYLNFEGNCEEAFTFYETVFDTKNIGIHRFGDMPANPEFVIPDEAKNKVMHTALLINENTMLMGSDTFGDCGGNATQGSNTYLMLDTATADEAHKLYDKLTVDAQKIEMPLGEQFWAELYSSFTDKFGINWMIHFEGNKAQH